MQIYTYFYNFRDICKKTVILTRGDMSGNYEYLQVQGSASFAVLWYLSPL